MAGRIDDFYILEAGDAEIAWTITDGSGEPIDRYGDTRYCEASRAVAHIPYLDSDPDVPVTGTLPDLIGVGLDVLICDRVFRQLASLSIEPGVFWLQVEIRNRRGGIFPDPYHLPYTNETWHNVLDVKASNAKLYSGGMLGKFEKFVAYRSRIPGYDLWFAHGRHWICSTAFCNLLRKGNRGNARLTRVAFSTAEAPDSEPKSQVNDG